MLILGHRGAIIDGAAFYQNSLRGFQEALATGDGFETDACADKDGEVFLIHEAKYADAAKGVEYCMAEHMDSAGAVRLGARRIDELTTDEMAALRLRDGSLVPRLKDALALVGAQTGKLINIELKAFDVGRHVARLVKDAFAKKVIQPGNVMISSFNHPALPDIRKALPDVRLGAIVMEDDMPSAPLFPWQPGSAGAYLPLTEATLLQPVLKQAQPDIFVMPEKLLTQGSVELIAAHYPKAMLAGWVFTERGNFDLADLQQRLKTLPAGKIFALMLDNPRKGLGPGEKREGKRD